MVIVLCANPFPHSSQGFYATNNPFQTSGPKGRIESKMIGNNRIFMRIDLPGVEQGNVTVTIDDSKRGVLIKAEEQSRNKNVSSLRSYETHVTLGYHCCEISTIDNPQVTDGVLRLFISTTPLNINGVPCCADEDIHGYLVLHERDDPNMAYENERLPDGSAYLRLDMPGVPKDDFTTDVVDKGRVKVTGHAPAVSHDSSGRSYSADAGMLCDPGVTISYLDDELERYAENGVMRLTIRDPCLIP
ncbi:hypothetical protein IGI04_012730 [Brassica rapa subsp. trilocularis]|uniref:SHSP domain-containing protein n=1 Tax=Brassica rapa subsp. trilocularis TaxID=1813537 RepID=A0ABQ7N8U7_BRACM|nr:hypothetical protein IGI04_012730 [Brassica rapa subsp. trilocularis]